MSHHRPRALLFAIALLICAGRARSTTLMVLADWYFTSTMDTLVSVDSLWVPHVDTIRSGGVVSINGYYRGVGNLKLVRTDVFARPIAVNQGPPDSIPLPRALNRSWFSLPRYVSTDFHGITFRFMFDYLGGRHYYLGNANPPRVILETLRRSTSTTELVGLHGKSLIDRCIDSLWPADTIWLRQPGSISNVPSELVCSNHNPFWEERGLVFFHPPVPVTELVMDLDGMQVGMTGSKDFPGWYTAHRLDSSTLSASRSVGLSFRGKGTRNQSLVWNNGGTPWRVELAKGDSLWMLHEGPASNQDPISQSPVVWIGFPSDSRLALLADGEGFVGKPVLSGWVGRSFWERPRTVWLTHLDGSRSPPIAIPATGDSIWLDGNALSSRPLAPSLQTVVLQSRAFDYDKNYNPFAEKGPDDNCIGTGNGGKATKGLVENELDSAGFPVWTGKVACDIGTAADGPGNWFKSGRSVLETTISIPLWRIGKSDEWSYSNSQFFPLDTVKTTEPVAWPNYRFCLHHRFETTFAPNQYLKVMGDDDIWLFAQKRLVIDLGGQHGPDTGTFAFEQLGVPEGKTIKFDLFHCERHGTGSSFGVWTNALLQPIGTIKEHPDQTSELRHRETVSLRLGLSGRRMRVASPSATAWNLEIRTLDGRRILERSGIGSTDLEPSELRGLVVASLRSGNERLVETVYLR